MVVCHSDCQYLSDAPEGLCPQVFDPQIPMCLPPCYEDNRFRAFQEVLGGFNFSGFQEDLAGFKGRRARK